MADDLRFAYFTDTHIVRPGVQVRGVDTCRTLERVVDAVNNLKHRPALVIVGGDLASPDLDEEVRAGAREVTYGDYESAYTTLRALLAPLAVPTYLLLGNHDRRGPFRRVVLGEDAPEEHPHRYVVDVNGYRLCALDSLDPGKKPGLLGDGQLAWLRDRLRETADRHAVVVVHHHPVPVGVRRLDEQMLTDADALWDVVRAAGNVRGVLCGHVHLRHEDVHEGVPVFITPSTCFQSSKQFQEQQYLPGPPVLRVVTCRAGHITSEVLEV